MLPKPRPARTLPLLAAALIAGCASTPKGPSQAEITQEVVAQASVQAVDKAARRITLERADGVRMVVDVGPEVRNFDRIKAGDTLKARYVETLSVRRLRPDEVAAEPTYALGVGRAEAGARPAGGIGAGFALTVMVQSVDAGRHTVVFTDPAGALRVVRAERDEGRAFVAGLRPGDRVEIVYEEATVLSVEE